jgi:hypothetical protein
MDGYVEAVQMRSANEVTEMQSYQRQAHEGSLSKMAPHAQAPQPDFAGSEISPTNTMPLPLTEFQDMNNSAPLEKSNTGKNAFDTIGLTLHAFTHQMNAMQNIMEQNQLTNNVMTTLIHIDIASRQPMLAFGIWHSIPPKELRRNCTAEERTR